VLTKRNHNIYILKKKKEIKNKMEITIIFISSVVHQKFPSKAVCGQHKIQQSSSSLKLRIRKEKKEVCPL